MPTSSSLEVTPSPHDRFRLLFAAAGGLGLLLLVTTLPAVGATLIVAALAAWLVVRPMLGFAVFTWLLPFHILVMAVLFGGLGISGTIVRGIAAWKEVLIALLFGLAILRTVTGRGVRPFIAWLDLAVGGLFVISLISLLAVNPFSGREIPFLAQAYGRSGQTDKIRPLLAEAAESSDYMCPYETATAYLLLGEVDHAFELMDDAVAFRSNCLIFTRYDPRLEPMRGDPRFTTLLAKVGLDDESVKAYPR